MRTALALLRPDSTTATARDLNGDNEPRGHLFEDMFSVVWDQHTLPDAGHSPLPEWFRLAQEVYRRQDEYDVIVTWSERLTLSLLMLQQLAGPGKPHIAIFTQFAKPNIDWPMRVLGRHLRAALAFSSVQGRLAVERGHVDPARLYMVRYFVDAQFYRPVPGAADLICAVGAEMRDYPTLFAALEHTDLRCHVAADIVRVPGRLRLVKDRRVHVGSLQRTPNPHLTIARQTLPELRALYARSRFVVVPLLPSLSDNGVTVILEAMAMGKAVICSATAGQVDVIEHGVTGILVPPGDPVALRTAMLDLWNDPDKAQAIGARARARVDRYHTLEQFCANAAAAIDDAMRGGAGDRRAWWDADTVASA